MVRLQLCQVTRELGYLIRLQHALPTPGRSTADADDAVRCALAAVASSPGTHLLLRVVTLLLVTRAERRVHPRPTP